MPAVPKPAPRTHIREMRARRAAARAEDPPPVRYKGVTAQRRAKKHAQLVEAEVTEKDQVRERDRVCRWPYCPCQDNPFAVESQLEVSHCIAHKGAGGDPQMLRTRRDLMILVCHAVHQGPDGIDAGRRRVVPLTDRGTDGPVECYRLEPGEGGRWYFAGISYPPEPPGEAV